MAEQQKSSKAHFNLKQAIQSTRDIEGWLTEKEGIFLYKMANKCTGRGVIVEIGSWKGKSTIWLSLGSKYGKHVKVYAIDPHTGSPEHKGKINKNIWTFEKFKENIRKAKVIRLVTPIVSTSEKAVRHWKKPIELLFIDGRHEYEMVKKDFLVWYPYVIEKGIIAIHDTTACMTGENFGWPGPRKVANTYMFNPLEICKAGIVDTITYAQKCKANTYKNRIQMRLSRILKYAPDILQIFVTGAISFGKNILYLCKHK